MTGTLVPLRRSGPGAPASAPDPADNPVEVDDMAKRTCSIPDCDSDSWCRGWCRLHYGRWRNFGDPDWQPPTAVELFWAKVSRTSPSTCWIWTGATNNGGYGVGWTGTATRLAHRLAYEYKIGPIPAGLHIDHLCRNRLCVNPDHLEAVTQAENNRRAGAARTDCAHGHPYDEANTYWTKAGTRVCRTCQRRWRGAA